MANTILLVDDEAAVLKTLARLLEPVTVAAAGSVLPAAVIRTAANATEAEAYLVAHPDCAVVVSDLRMPGMDGLSFLERVRTVAPDAVRVLLTGDVDVGSAIEAINRTAVFRLLTKPCGASALCTAVGDALKQHQLVISERQLLDQTLRGSVQVLVEMMTLIDPAGSSRALRIQRYVQHITHALSLPNAWALEIAAMLSHLGSLTLGATEQGHASVGYDLLKHIHRLEGVASIIARQDDPVDPADTNVPLLDRDSTRTGGQALRVAIAFDAAIVAGVARDQALAKMLAQPEDFDPIIVESLRDAELPERQFEKRHEQMSDLALGMILDEDLRNASGVLIMPRGQEITMPVLARLRSFGSPADRRKRLQVLAPRADLPNKTFR